MQDIQSILALAVFLGTTVFFVYRSLNAKKENCPGGCGCSKKE